MTISGRVFAGVDGGVGPVLQAQKEDAQEVWRGIPGIAIVGDGAKKFLVDGTVEVVVTAKEVLVCLVGGRTDWALVEVMLIDVVFIGMGG